MIVVIIFILLIPGILFVNRISSTIRTISKENRKVNHLLPWLTFIPILGYLVLLVVVIKLNQSLKLEFKTLNIPNDPQKPTLYYGVLACLFSIPFTLGENDIFDLLAVASLIFFILYWIRIIKLQKILLGIRPK